MRLQCFEDTCAKRGTLKTRLQGLMEKVKTMAVNEVRYADSALEKLRDRAAVVRAGQE